MWRALRFLVVLGAVAAGAAWLAGQQGAATFEWRGYRVETTTAVLAAAVAAAAVATALLYRLWLFICRVPAALGRVRRDGRRRRGYLALTRGMVAVAAGDAEDARRQGKRAEGLLDDPPLTMLLSAQAAQLAGDERAAEKFFTAMLKRPETEFLGLRGLLAQSLKQADWEQGLALARRAYRLKPKSDWVAANLFDLQLRAGQWADAEMTLVATVRGALVGAEEGARRHAVLLHQRSLEAGARADGADSLRLARQAFEKDPAFVPGAVRLARLCWPPAKRERPPRRSSGHGAASPIPTSPRFTGRRAPAPTPWSTCAPCNTWPSSIRTMPKAISPWPTPPSRRGFGARPDSTWRRSTALPPRQPCAGSWPSSRNPSTAIRDAPANG